MNVGTYPGVGHRKVAGPMRPPTFTNINGDYTFKADDAGCGYYNDETATRTWTIPRDTFVEEDMIWLARRGSATYYLQVAAGTGVTLTLAGSTASGTRRIVVNGMAVIYFTGPNTAVLYGSGIA